MSEQTSRTEMVEGDITTQAVGAIGNAASETLLGGGGGTWKYGIFTTDLFTWEF